MNTYDIAVASDERFMPGAMLALASLARNAKLDSELVFHLFTEQVNAVTINELRYVLSRIHSKSVVKVYECDDKLLEGLPSWAGSRMASVRVLFPEILKTVDRCLYLDCDIVYLASVEEHFSYFDDDKYGVVVKDEGDHFSLRECNRIKMHIGEEIDANEYFNSGVILFNFKKMREDGVSRKLFDFMKQHPDSLLPDQTALNCIFNHHVVMAPGKYNRLLPQLTPEKIYECPVLHYISGKPWTPKLGEVANSRFRFWHAYADKVIWQSNGESMRRLFSRRMICAKYLFFRLLRMPIIGPGFSWAMHKLGKTAGAPQGWRAAQIIPLHESRAMRMAFKHALER